LAQEKLDEIAASFRHFDKNGNGVLDKTEFKAALSALGVPFKDDAAFQKTFNEVAEGLATVSLEQYTAFNVKLMEDRDTPDQINASFQMLADSGNTISLQQLRTPPLTDEDLAYLQAHLPDSGDGRFDYSSWVALACARPQ